MSASVSILGNLGRDPETRITPDGSLVASFSIASNSVRRHPEGTVKKTDWFRVTAFGDKAQVLSKYAKRGDKLFVEGKLTLSAWLDREGAPQVSADLLLQDFQFVGSSERDGETGGAIGDTAEYSVETEIAGDVQEVANQSLDY
jgi:single-strand DNA-binding protein